MVFGAQYLHLPVPHLCTLIPWLEDPYPIPLFDPPHYRPELPAEHQAVVCLRPVLHRLLSLGDGEVLCARVQSILH